MIAELKKKFLENPEKFLEADEKFSKVQNSSESSEKFLELGKNFQILNFIQKSVYYSMKRSQSSEKVDKGCLDILAAPKKR